METPPKPLQSPKARRGRVLAGAIIATASAGAGALAASLLGAPIEAALFGSIASLVLAGGLVFGMGRAHRGEVAGDPSAHKRALEQLSEELISLASPTDVAGAIERTIRRLLPGEGIEIAFASTSSGAAIDRAAPARDPKSGEHEISALARHSGDSQHLALPVEFHGVRLGQLEVRSSRGTFSEREDELLRAIAHEGGLALAHAVAYSELEKRRKQQVAAWRDEREALVETISAEIAHEVRYPINFFRTIFQRASGYRTLEEEDIEIGCEEVDRLERLVSGLRRMATQHVERRAVEVSELCARAEMLLRDRVGGHALQFDLEGGGTVHCDIDKVTQVLVNLLANALEATEEVSGSVGVEWRLGGHGGQLTVWDTGPGFDGDPSRLFAPWYTTKPRGTGLGLAITYRLVRAHGWNIEASRRESKTVFVVAIPSSDIVASSGNAGESARRKKGEVA